MAKEQHPVMQFEPLIFTILRHKWKICVGGKGKKKGGGDNIEGHGLYCSPKAYRSSTMREESTEGQSARKIEERKKPREGREMEKGERRVPQGFLSCTT